MIAGGTDGVAEGDGVRAVGVFTAGVGVVRIGVAVGVGVSCGGGALTQPENINSKTIATKNVPFFILNLQL